MSEVIDVPEMHCQACVNGISSALEGVPGLRHFDVDLPRRQVTVDFDESQVTREQIEQRIEDAGFDVVKR